MYNFEADLEVSRLGEEKHTTCIQNFETLAVYNRVNNELICISKFVALEVALLGEVNDVTHMHKFVALQAPDRVITWHDLFM